VTNRKYRTAAVDPERNHCGKMRSVAEHHTASAASIDKPWQWRNWSQLSPRPNQCYNKPALEQRTDEPSEEHCRVHSAQGLSL
jgi:hypothetical protein